MTKLVTGLAIPALLLFTGQPILAADDESTVEGTVEGTPGESAWNFERVGTMVTADGETDLRAYSKLGPWPNTDGNILYSGCYDPSTLTADNPGSERCFVTVDLSNPEKPVNLATVYTYDREKSPSPLPDHVVWSNDYPFPNLPVQVPCMVDWQDPLIATGNKAPACWDPGWNTHSHYVQKGPGDVLGINMERYRAGSRRQASDHGVKFYDVSDPSQPEYLSYWEAPVTPPDPEAGVYRDARGTHHFNFDGDYLYLGTEYEGYIGRILIIVDVSDARNPKETGKWWVPGQKTPEEDDVRDWQQQPTFIFPVVKNDSNKWTKHVGMHYATVYGDRAYLSYHQAGLVILDIKDKSQPRFISRMDYLIPGADPTNPDIETCKNAAGGQDAACGNAHSAKRIPGRDNLLIMSDEYFTCPYGHVRMFDISDETNPRIMSHFLIDQNTACDEENGQKPADPSQYRTIDVGAAEPFVIGASSHIGNAWGSDLYFMAWYGKGVRAIDISDPYNLVEAGYYEYKIDKDFGINEPGWAGSHAYDVTIGQDGHLYVPDASSGLRVLKYTGPAGPR